MSLGSRTTSVSRVEMKSKNNDNDINNETMNNKTKDGMSNLKKMLFDQLIIHERQRWKSQNLNERANISFRR